MRIPMFNKKQKELLADLWELDEYERKEIAMFLIASTLNPGSHSRIYSQVKRLDKNPERDVDVRYKGKDYLLTISKIQ